MKKAVIYPYDISNLHIVMFSENMAEIKISAAVSPSGWGYSNHDAGYRYGISTNVFVKDNLKEELEKCDTLILTDSIIELDCEKIEKAIKAAQDLNKEIIDLRKDQSSDDKVTFIDNRLRKISKPVILVIGTSERCGKFDIQLLLRKTFEKQGYKVTQIGSKNSSEYFKMHSYPQFMYSSKLQEYEKILAFNQYVYKLSMSEESDAIIIGVPGGITRYDDKHIEYFGMQNFYVSNAITPDYVVMNISYVDFIGQYIDSTLDFVNRRYNYNVDALVLSNSYINADATSEREKIIYTSLKEDFVSEEANKLQIYSLFNEESRTNLGKRIIDTLEGYGEVSAI